jgi:hypothetical protein
VKRQVHPLIALVIIIAVVAAAGYFMMQRTRYDSGQTPGVRIAKPKK